MILDHCTVPSDGSTYTFPRTQIQLSVPQARRVASYVVMGGKGALDPYGAYAYPMAASIVTYRFRVAPQQGIKSIDDLREDLIVAAAHGEPQDLFFMEWDGTFWKAQGKCIRFDAATDVQSPFYEDFEVAWELANPELSALAAPGVLVWGQAGLKWGQAGLKWGATPYAWNLNLGSIPTTITNPNGTVPTTDMTFEIQGTYGPATSPVPTLANGLGIVVANQSIMYGSVPHYFRIIDTLGPGESYSIAFDSLTVRKNGVPAWQNLYKPNYQDSYMKFKRGTNLVVVYISGTPRSSLNGRVVMKWKPHRTF